MKSLFFLAVLIVACAMIYLAFTGQLGPVSERAGQARTPSAHANQQRRPAQKENPVDTVHKVVQSNRNVGKSTSKALKSIGISGD